MTDLVETLKDAAHQKALVQAEPEIQKLGKILEAVASYQEAFIEVAEVAIVNVALTALGQPEVKPELDVTALRKELEALFAAFGRETEPRLASEHSRKPGVSIGVPSNPLQGVNLPVASTETVVPVPAAVFVTAAHRADDPGAFEAVLKETPLPKPMNINPADVEKAWELIQEVERTDGTSEPALRLEMLLQAWAAEARLIMEKLPAGNEAYEALGERVIRHVTNLKKDLGVGPYIKGLAFGASANWYRLSTDARKRIRKFDKDANGALHVSSNGSSNGVNSKGQLKNPVLKSRPLLPSESTDKPTYVWPELQNLRKYMEEYPLLIIGGRTRDTAKIDVIHERYGVRCEWCELDPGSIRSIEALAEKISNGKVAGVLLVENFMSHKAYRKFSKAADQGSVPLVLTGKGGVGAIGEALQALERQLSIALYKIPKIEAKEGSA